MDIRTTQNVVEINRSEIIKDIRFIKDIGFIIVVMIFIWIVVVVVVSLELEL